ncbi:MAG: hypothetical protein J6Z38_05270, partial [Lachnospiraceae bacterium]|nr:hypothetical protein [Lachnospiraceae bacterium]
MTEPKPFKEVFPELKTAVQDGILSFITVTRLAFSKDRSMLNVYTDVSRLVDRASFRRIEKDIARQYPDETWKVRLIPHFSLPGSYTLDSIVEEYRDSLVEELGEENPMYRGMLRKCTFNVPDEHTLQLCFDDSPL